MILAIFLLQAREHIYLNIILQLSYSEAFADHNIIIGGINKDKKMPSIENFVSVNRLLYLRDPNLCYLIILTKFVFSEGLEYIASIVLYKCNIFVKLSYLCLRSEDCNELYTSKVCIDGYVLMIIYQRTWYM
jgi:hypothetical protein